MSSFSSFLKNELNVQQREAVLQKHGTFMVIAGAGSGKTRVITARIAHLILNEDVDPTTIIALTFTNKAANEMKERLTHFLGTNASIPFVGTFHSYCLLLLRSHPHLLPFSYFSIMDADDQRALVKKILKRHGLEKQITASQMSHLISQAKNKQGVDLDELFVQPVYKEIFHTYETEKAAAHCLDFDDLLIQMLSILEKNESFRTYFQQRIRHILIDEYQDTSMVQHALLKAMALDKTQKNSLDSICAVGDADQSIYSWRGAMVTNMLTFQDDFAPVSVIKIEQNYRSVQPILEAANEVIAHNSQRHPKKLWSDKKADNRIMLASCLSGYQEADCITSFLSCLPDTIKRSDVAILYRTHFQSRSIEETLLRSGIAYHIVGGIRFYERKEIKDLLGYLRLVVNPYDRTSFFRIINCPTRGLGVKFEELVYQQWQQNPLYDFKQLLNHLLAMSDSPIKGIKATCAEQFLSLFDGCSPDDAPHEVLEKLIERAEYLSFLRTTLDAKEADAKIENVREFVESSKHFEQTIDENESNQDEKREATLATFLHEIALLQEKMNKPDAKTDHVQLMTLHAVKGLEFDTVFITGLEEGLLPSSRSLYSATALEEERRLFYVGITRAKERLILLHAQQRASYGKVNHQLASRFATELPDEHLYHLDLTSVSSYKFPTLFAQWLGTKLPASSLVTFGARRITQNTKIKTKKIQAKGISGVPWKKNQPVVHKTFGAGIIKQTEKRGDDEYHLTIQFKSGTKKILSRFVTAV